MFLRCLSPLFRRYWIPVYVLIGTSSRAKDAFWGLSAKELAKWGDVSSPLMQMQSLGFIRHLLVIGGFVALSWAGRGEQFFLAGLLEEHMCGKQGKHDKAL